MGESLPHEPPTEPVRGAAEPGRGGSPHPPRDPADLEAELRLVRREPLSLRAWFYPFIFLLAALVAIRYSYGDTSRAAVLAGLFAYLSVACTFCPLPTTPMIVWAACPLDQHGLGIPPLVVATAGAVATAIANMHDYYLLTFLYRYKPVRRIRTTRLYSRVALWYNRAPFATLAAASFLPIPVDFVRLLAISEGYNRAKFALGSLVGRWPRYLAFAVLADQFKLGWQWVLGILGVTVVLGLWRSLPPLVKWIRLKSRRGSNVDNDSDVPG
jgi:membrane protein YqaA with SNARE-associated domain